MWKYQCKYCKANMVIKPVSPRQHNEQICRYYDPIVDPTKVEVSLQSLLFQHLIIPRNTPLLSSKIRCTCCKKSWKSLSGRGAAAAPFCREGGAAVAAGWAPPGSPAPAQPSWVRLGLTLLSADWWPMNILTKVNNNNKNNNNNNKTTTTKQQQNNGLWPHRN